MIPLFDAGLKIVAGALSVWDRWLGSYVSPQATTARIIARQKERADEFAKLEARAKAGDLEAQNEIRKRMARPVV